MKTLNGLLACLLILVPLFARADGFDSELLLGFCKATVQMFEREPLTTHALSTQEALACFSYVRGIDEGVHVVAVNNIARKHGKKAIANRQYLKEELPYCTPSEVTLKQKVQVIVKFTENNPQLLHEEPAVLTVLALKWAFPCK